MTWLVLVVAAAVVAFGGAAAAIVAARSAARRVKENYQRSNQVVPGIASNAPTGWLGSHDPEAKLHRRLIDAIRALHASQDLDTIGTYLDLRVEIEQRAIEIDNELVVTAGLPVPLREAPLERLNAEVSALEAAVAEVGVAAASGRAGRMEELLAEIRRRTSSLDRTREVLEELDRRERDEVGGSDEDGEPGTAGGAGAAPG